MKRNTIFFLSRVAVSVKFWACYYPGVCNSCDYRLLGIGVCWLTSSNKIGVYEDCTIFVFINSFHFPKTHIKCYSCLPCYLVTLQHMSNM